MDDLEGLVKLIEGMTYTGTEDDTQPFVFSSECDANGTHVVGNGSDTEPFFIGVMTKALLARLDKPATSFVFHIDGTFKLNQVDYPVFVCGISDQHRSFHLVSLFIASHQQERHMTWLLKSLRTQYAKVVGNTLELRYVLGDGDDAQFNAVREVFRDQPVDYLMCFFHVVMKVYKYKSSVSATKMSLITADIYDMHYAKSASTFFATMTAAVRRWMDDPDTAGFGAYFRKQWLTGKFTKWQCFHTPVGYATTNNPVEQFNAKLKKTYTMRKRLKMGLLLVQLAKCCNDASEADTTFALTPIAWLKILNRARALRRRQLLVETPFVDSSDRMDASLHGDDLDYFGGSVDSVGDFVAIRSKAVPRVYVAPRKRTYETLEIKAQMKKHAERMERDEQPEAGWAVSVHDGTCPCKFFKYGTCVHLLMARYVRFGAYLPGKPALIRRGKKRSLETMIADAYAATRASRGRPILNRPALSLV